MDAPHWSILNSYTSSFLDNYVSLQSTDQFSANGCLMQIQKNTTPSTYYTKGAMSCLCNFIHGMDMLQMSTNTVQPYNVDPCWNASNEMLMLRGETDIRVQLNEFKKAIDDLLYVCSPGTKIDLPTDTWSAAIAQYEKNRCQENASKDPYFIQHLHYIVSNYIRNKWQTMSLKQRKFINFLLENTKTTTVFDHLSFLGYDAILHNESENQLTGSDEDEDYVDREMERKVENTLAMDFIAGDSQLCDRIIKACNRCADRKRRMPYTQTLLNTR